MTRTRLCASVAAILLAFGFTPVGHPVTEAQAPKPRYGVVTSILTPQHGAKVTELGAGSVRLNFYWRLIEPSQDDYNWAEVDQWLSQAQSRNLSVFASLTEAPPWAAASPYFMPYSILDWHEFVYRVLEHVKNNFPTIDIVFGVWNEPNLGFLNDDSQATNYKVLFEYANQARNVIYPSARLAGPETSHHAVADNSYFDHAMNKILPYMGINDKITVHWYPNNDIGLSGYMGVANGRSQGQDVWLTEVGNATCNDGAQASTLNTVMNIFQPPTGAWKKTFIYVLHTGSACDESIVRGDWTNRQAFTAYKDWIATH